MPLALLFHYLMLNMFRMLIHPSSGACDLFVEYFMGCIALVRCVLVLRCGLAVVVWYPYAGWGTNNEIIKQVTSSWSLFFQLSESLVRQNLITTSFVAAIKIYINSLICKAMGYVIVWADYARPWRVPLTRLIKHQSQWGQKSSVSRWWGSLVTCTDCIN